MNAQVFEQYVNQLTMPTFAVAEKVVVEEPDYYLTAKGSSSLAAGGEIGLVSLKLTKEESEESISFTLDGKFGTHINRPLHWSLKQTSQVAQVVALTKAINYCLDLAVRCSDKGVKTPFVAIRTNSHYAFNWLNGTNKKLGVNADVITELQSAARQLAEYREFSIRLT